MVVPSLRWIGFLSMQLLLFQVNLAHGGIPVSQGSLAVDANDTKSTSDDPNPAGDENGRAAHQKFNDSPKHRSETTRDFNEDDVFSSSPSISQSAVGTRRSNASDASSESVVSPAPSAPSASPSPPAANASSATPYTMADVERLARLEMLKRDFLTQLGMDSPPNITKPKQSVPSVVLNRLMRDGAQSDQPQRQRTRHPRQIVVFADEDQADCGSDVAEESCFKFEVSDEVGHSMVFSSHLWVYVTHAPEGASVFVGVPQHHHGSQRRVLASKKLYSQEGWVEVEIPVDKHKWNRHQHYFEISTKTLLVGENLTVARDSDHRPMLLLALTLDNPLSRSRRGTGSCTRNQTSCCKKDFVADFTLIGWHSWIITPLTFNAHYCSGTCGMESQSHFFYDNTDVVARLLEEGHAETGMAVCCVPDGIGGLVVIYFDENSVIHSRMIDVVVTDCGCV